MLIAFELLLLVSLYLLRLTAKSDRVLLAAVEMFFWTLVGSLALLLSFLLMLLQGSFISVGGFISQPIQPMVVFLLCLGFGVKLPI
jgi:formate hydrogenlyase subunit 3/multisubunit Na+/H+ antiporter MnhD subunit